MLLKDRVALITGGAKGIGRGMSLKFASEGAKVTIADIAVKEAEDTAAEIKKQNGQALAIKCDITSLQQVAATVEEVMKKFGRIDILVNNAGAMAGHGAIEELSEEDWDKVFAINLKSDFFFCKYVVPDMKKRRYGKIINVSSIGAVQPPAHAIHYNSAKAGVIGFTMDLANALAPFNINVNCILPGPVRSSFYDRTTATMTEEQKDAFFKFLGTKVPMQRIGTPEDIAGAALFLASDLAAYITGHALYVSGGLPLLPPSPPLRPN